MDRRVFVTGLGAWLVTPFAAEAQQAGKVRRIGIIGLVRPPPSQNAPLEAFRGVLRERGWIEGKNLDLERRFSEGKAERVAAFVDEFVRMQTDVIVTVGDLNLAAAARATRTIPIVIATGGDPIKLGVAESLARPGGNVTGAINFAGPEVFGKYLQFLKEIRPQIRHLGILWDLDPGLPHLGEMLRAARTLGQDASVQEIRTAAEWRLR
jgi:putative tryptophan/tyrosine transport system substrate-binding protein